MTDVQIKEALSRVIADVLERFAFSFAEEEDGVVEEDGECLCADLAFRGPVRGTVSLSLPRALAVALGANILGADPGDVGPEVGEDAVKELCNIICGELLPLLFGLKAVFDLSVPALRMQAGAAKMPPGSTVVRVCAEGYRVAAAFSLAKD
jgi:CheY-specific phosphatase CheX